MKISQKQASLLAREIIKQLKAKKVQRVPDHIKEQLKNFNNKRRVLMNEKADVEEKINKHDMTLVSITGKINRLYAGDSLTSMIEKMEEKNIPSVGEIEDKIILQSMFASEDDMEKFVNRIVKEYEKKVQSKILSV